MSWWDGVGEIIDDVTGWVGRNEGRIDAVGNLVGRGQDIFSAVSQNNAEQAGRNQMLDALERQLQARHQRQNELYNWHLQNSNAQAAASAAASAARASAARQNNKLQRKAEKKALRGKTGRLKDIAAMYDPYIQAGKELIPKQAQTYGNFLDTTQLLNAYLQPMAQQVIQPPRSVSDFKPQDKSVFAVTGPTGQGGFPDLNELLKRGG